LLYQAFNQELFRSDDGRIFREWSGISDRRQSLFDQFWVMAIVGSEEGFQGCSAGLVQLFES